jgi:hypothetical protein
VLGRRQIGCRTDLEQRLLDDATRRPIDGPGRRPGGRDDYEK